MIHSPHSYLFTLNPVSYRCTHNIFRAVKLNSVNFLPIITQEKRWALSNLQEEVLLLTEKEICVLLALHSSAAKSMVFNGSQLPSAVVAPSLRIYPKNGPGAKLIFKKSFQKMSLHHLFSSSGAFLRPQCHQLLVIILNVSSKSIKIKDRTTDLGCLCSVCTLHCAGGI